MRLDKYLSEAGKGTRKDVKKLILKGRVSVDRVTVRDPAAKVPEEGGDIRLDGFPVVYKAYEYFMLNKPKGVLSATRASAYSGSICVTDLIKDKVRSDLFPVGRLDKDTEGLLIITNDGALAHRLLSPRRKVGKTYFATLDSAVSPGAAGRIMEGTDIGDKKRTLPCEITMLTECTCLITIYEGRYHEIKRMFATEGLAVTELKRLSMGPLELDRELSPGGSRPLYEEEIEALREFVSIREEKS